MIIKGLSFAEIYEKAAITLMKNPQYVTAPRGLKINELLNVQIELTNPSFNLFYNPVRSVPLKYLADELILYFSGANDAKYFSKASPFWDKIKNSDGTVNSAYGHLIFCMNDGNGLSQWEWAVNSLRKDKDSRQAIMHYNRPMHQYDGVKDFPCTISNQFFIRNDQLHLTSYMRSNDIFFGLTFDLPFFTILMHVMILELKDLYPNLILGTYTHFDGSLHAYEKDFDTLNKMIKYPFKAEFIPKPTVSPIFHDDIMLMRQSLDFEPYSKDSFIKWLDYARKVIE